MTTGYCDHIVSGDDIDTDVVVCGKPATHHISSPSWADEYGSCDEHLEAWGEDGDHIDATPLLESAR